jgi:ribosomal protein L31E
LGITTPFPAAIIKGNRLALLRDMAILLLIAGFFALAFIPSYIVWVQKPLNHYLKNRGIQNPNPSSKISTPKRVIAINIFFTFVLILAFSFASSTYRVKMGRSNLTRVFSVADKAILCVEDFIASHNGQLPKSISETGFSNIENRYVSSVIFNAEDTSVKLILNKFYSVNAGASLTFIKRGQGWDCLSNGIPQIYFMQRKCPDHVETTKN